MLLQLRHMEDIVDLLEAALEVKYIGCLPHTLQHLNSLINLALSFLVPAK